MGTTQSKDMLCSPGSPNVVKVEDKSPNPQALKPVKKEPDSRAQGSKSPHNG